MTEVLCNKVWLTSKCCNNSQAQDTMTQLWNDDQKVQNHLCIISISNEILPSFQQPCSALVTLLG